MILYFARDTYVEHISNLFGFKCSVGWYWCGWKGKYNN